jgi:tetratricopeptide (TPR) repeat protein
VSNSGEIIDILFRLPLHIFQIAQAVGDSVATDEHYEAALEYYKSLITDDPNDPGTALSHTALAKLYHETGQWALVISQLQKMADRTTDISIDIQINIADIYNRLPQGRDSALAIYQGLLENLTPADSGYRPRLKFKIALMAMERSEYQRARDLLVELKKNHPLYYSSAPLVQFTIARAFELLGRWDRAETEYVFLIENYRGSQQAMATYLLLGDHYSDLDRTDETQKWYNDAEENYNEIAARGTGTLLEARALTFKANLFHRMGDSKRTAELLVSLFDKFPGSDSGRSSLLRAAVIYRNQLNQPELSDSLVDRLRSMLVQPEQGWGT